MHANDLQSFLQALSEGSSEFLNDLAVKAASLIEGHEEGLRTGNLRLVLSTESLQRCYAVLDAATTP